MTIIESIQQFAAQEYRERLDRLHQALAQPQGLWELSVGTYPASHDGVHIQNVVSALVKLHDALPAEAQLSPRCRSLVLAAAMIHDVGMSLLRNLGASSEQAHQARLRHSNPLVIAMLAEDLLRTSRFPTEDATEVLAIAAAHSSDDSQTVDEKIADAKRDRLGTDRRDIELAIRLLGLADYLDLGRERLVQDFRRLYWDEEQFAHLRKHAIIAHHQFAKGIFGLSLEQRVSFSSDNLCVLHAAREDLKIHLRHLNALLGLEWYLKPLDEECFGEVVPLSTASGLFLRELQAAKRGAGRGAPIEIDMMGHSLYQRFVSDRGKLNESLKSLLRDTPTQMRVLVLDPNCETQQACEVLDGQWRAPEQSERGRSILPLFDSLGEKIEFGDIDRTLRAIDENWASRDGLRGSLEVRSTCRLIYASIVRFENRMIVTPYVASGLFNQSGGILLTNQSPVFQLYEAEFQSLWDHPWETRLLRHVSNQPRDVQAAIRRIVKDDPVASRGVPGFRYERRILHDKRRLRRMFDRAASAVVPPTEVEIQPTSACELSCTHCIGAHLNSPQAVERCALGTEDFGWLEAMLKWSEGEDGWKVERFRISGLHGDPLAGPAREFTQGAITRIKAADREVVLFTNGLGLSDPNTLRDAVEADFIHISLDASTPETFKRMKGVDAFDRVIENARQAKRMARQLARPCRIGFGFVVTQENYREADQAIARTAEQGLDFVRFRRDIHRPDALGWRAWCTARNRVKRSYERNVSGRKPELYVMDLPKRHWSLRPEKCWMQHYCVTVGPDAYVYPCDHLSGMRAHAFGNLREKSFKEIMCGVGEKLTRVCGDCWQCPPFNSRGNQVLDQMNVLFKSYGFAGLERWLDGVLPEPGEVARP